MMKETDKIQEEYIDNKPTGLEYEEPGDSERNISKPYDPRQIRVDPKPLSIAQAMDLIQGGELNIAPEFQRRRVWNNVQKSLLIESIMLRIPLPVFYFSADEEGRMEVVDGVQRLSTMQDFTNNRFSLSSLEYLSQVLDGKKYEDIKNSMWSRRFLTTSLVAYVIDPQTPDTVKFDIFRRINTGGTPLNAQEMRHCISKSRSRDFLAALCAKPEFHQATRQQLKDNSRMMDMELALRYCAFSLLEDIDKYNEYEGLDDMLTKTVGKLDHSVTDDRLQMLESGFVRAMKNVRELFGDHAFCKWRVDNNYLSPINRALFDAWSVLLATADPSKILQHKESIVRDAREMMSNDNDFFSSISYGTSKYSQVTMRFEKVEALLGRYLP
ncbi:MAG: DUF262 domain-containing protein [Magnetococcales bacterium]|nr:DUF262 domain-containing protein [Magnetococcales bacterium]